MLLSRDLAGFTRGQSDELRKAMGKKLVDKMDALRVKFMDGCAKNGIGTKEKDNILNRLLDIKKKKKREHILFIENDVLKSPFECEEFISWITKVVE